MTGIERIGIIGGSGLSRWDALHVTDRIEASTRYGVPSAPLTLGRLAGHEVVFLPRHGDPHRIPPHRINYRANIQALHDVGVRQVIAVASVGAIGAGLAAGDIVLPDQIIDYTWGREHTFFDGRDDTLSHIDFTWPFDRALRAALLACARAAGCPARDGATYAATQGPRLESAAEIARLQRDGAHLVGMTGMPEAALAREAGLRYAMLAVVANDAAGTGASTSEVAWQSAQRSFENGLRGVLRLIEHHIATSGSAASDLAETT